MEEIAAPRLLEADDETQDFDCGVGVLNDWLKRRALLNHLSGASRTYVAMVGKRIAAYYCLSAGSIQHEAAPGKIRRNMPEPIPVLVLGRLAVDVRFQKHGAGPMLLMAIGVGVFLRLVRRRRIVQAEELPAARQAEIRELLGRD